ncbi:putative phospholipase D [Helianthus anomalus]
MCGWWLCPDLYLRRPFHTNAYSRLDSLLEAKAKQGVQVGYMLIIALKVKGHYFIFFNGIWPMYNADLILIYRELALALNINSFYSKKKLGTSREHKSSTSSRSFL